MGEYKYAGGSLDKFGLIFLFFSMIFILCMLIAFDFIPIKNLKTKDYIIIKEIPMKLNELEKNIQTRVYSDVADNLKYFAIIDKKTAGIFREVGGYDEEISLIVDPLKRIAYSIGIEHVRMNDGFGGIYEAGMRWNKIKALDNIKFWSDKQLLSDIKQVKEAVSQYKPHYYFPYLTVILYPTFLFLLYLTLFRSSKKIKSLA